jgi:hypothetical protein
VLWSVHHRLRAELSGVFGGVGFSHESGHSLRDTACLPACCSLQHMCCDTADCSLNRGASCCNTIVWCIWQVQLPAKQLMLWTGHLRVVVCASLVGG